MGGAQQGVRWIPDVACGPLQHLVLCSSANIHRLQHLDLLPHSFMQFTRGAGMQDKNGLLSIPPALLSTSKGATWHIIATLDSQADSKGLELTVELARPVCPGQPACSGHGTCITIHEAGAMCRCNAGWFGAACEVRRPLRTLCDLNLGLVGRHATISLLTSGQSTQRQPGHALQHIANTHARCTQDPSTMAVVQVDALHVHSGVHSASPQQLLLPLDALVTAIGAHDAVHVAYKPPLATAAPSNAELADVHSDVHGAGFCKGFSVQAGDDFVHRLAHGGSAKELNHTAAWSHAQPSTQSGGNQRGAAPGELHSSTDGESQGRAAASDRQRSSIAVVDSSRSDIDSSSRHWHFQPTGPASQSSPASDQQAPANAPSNLSSARPPIRAANSSGHAAPPAPVPAPAAAPATSKPANTAQTAGTGQRKNNATAASEQPQSGGSGNRAMQVTDASVNHTAHSGALLVLPGATEHTLTMRQLACECRHPGLAHCVASL